MSTPRPWAWRVAVPVVALLGGIVLAISREAAHGTDLRAGRSEQLADLIGEVQQRNARDAAQVDSLRRGVDKLAASSTDDRVNAVSAQVNALKDAAGLSPVSGAGVTVTLNDAPEGAIDRTYPGVRPPTPDDLVVHQQDVQAVVNALWSGGASAMQIMDQRVISTSAVRCVGNTLILQGRVYSPPFKITAVGDPARLMAELNRSEAVKIYKQYVKAYGLGYGVETKSAVTVPAYTGGLDLPFARTPE